MKGSPTFRILEKEVPVPLTKTDPAATETLPEPTILPLSCELVKKWVPGVP